jgi:hypothetical protein
VLALDGRILYVFCTVGALFHLLSPSTHRRAA